MRLVALQEPEMNFTVYLLYFCISSLLPWKDADNSEQLHNSKAFVLSHGNDNRGKAIKKGKTKCFFYLKDSEYVPLYQW